MESPARGTMICLMQLLAITGGGMSTRDPLELRCFDPFFFERNLVELDQAQDHSQSPSTGSCVGPKAIGHNGDLAAQPVPNHKADSRVVFSARLLLKHHRNLATPVRAGQNRDHSLDTRLGGARTAQVLNREGWTFLSG